MMTNSLTGDRELAEKHLVPIRICAQSRGRADVRMLQPLERSNDTTKDGVVSSAPVFGPAQRLAILTSERKQEAVFSSARGV